MFALSSLFTRSNFLIGFGIPGLALCALLVWGTLPDALTGSLIEKPLPVFSDGEGDPHEEKEKEDFVLPLPWPFLADGEGDPHEEKEKEDSILPLPWPFQVLIG